MNEREELAALRRLAELEAKAQGSQSPTFAQQLGASIREVPRQIGLTARYGMEAFGQTALPDIIGLPAPKDSNERVVADASRTAIGAMGIAKASGFASQMIDKTARPVLSAITESLGRNLGPQLTGAIGAGAAGGSVREAGGGPTEQFIASIVGGLGGGLAYGPMAASVNAAKGAAQRMFAPKDIKGQVSIALERAGVDWNALSAQAKQQLVLDAERALYRGEQLDPAAIRRLADFRNIDATPTQGAITMDPRKVTLEQNLSKSQANMAFVPGPDLAQIKNQNARTVIGALDSVEPTLTTPYKTGTRGIETIQQTDDALKNAERDLYDKARDSQGRSLELDRQGFVDGAFNNLAEKNRAPFLPPQVREVLNTLSKGGGQFTVDTIDSLKTMLAAESRKASRAGDGNTVAAVKAVRDALENVEPMVRKAATGSDMPITGAQGARLAQVDAARNTASQEALAAFDKARAAARGRRTWQESAAFVEDALSGVEPETWVQRHILNAKQNELAALRKELNRDPEFIAATRKQLIDYLKQKGSVDADTTTFSGKALSDAFDMVGEQKLALFFSGDELQRIKSAVRVAKYIDAQPKGSAVNNSNSAAMIVGRMLNSLLAAGTKMPFVGPWVAEPVKGAQVGFQARSAANVPAALALPDAAQPTGVPISPLLALALAPSSNQ